MYDTKITKALITVHELLSPVAKDWMIIGTTSLFLQGYDVKPNDIDILCSAAVVFHIDKALSLYKNQLEKSFGQDKFRSIFSRYNIEGIEVELMGDLEVNTGTGWINLNHNLNNPDQILFHNKMFRVPCKTDQLIIYNLFGREKDKCAIKMLKQ